MQKSLLFLGGSGFIGKSFLFLFAKNEIKNFRIKKITLISNNVEEIKKLTINSKFKKKIFIKSRNLLNVKDLPYADLIIHAAEYIDPKKILKNYNKIKRLIPKKSLVIGFGITNKTIKSLKSSDGLVVGSMLCKSITNSLRMRQNPVTKLDKIVYNLKNKII